MHARSTYDRNNVLGRLHAAGAWVLGIGLAPFGRSMTFFHYVEQREGVERRGWDYRHEKAFLGTVVVNGKAFVLWHSAAASDALAEVIVTDPERVYSVGDD